MSDESRIVSDKSKALEVARAAIDGKIELFDACSQLYRLRHTLGDIPERYIDLITGISSETDDYPTGTARNLWEPEALEALEGKFRRYRERVRAPVLEAFNAIVQCLSASRRGTNDDAFK